MNEDPTSKNMPHEEEFDNNNYESIEEKETAVWRFPAYDLKIFVYNVLHVNVYGLMCKESYHTFNYNGTLNA